MKPQPPFRRLSLRVETVDALTQEGDVDETLSSGNDSVVILNGVNGTTHHHQPVDANANRPRKSARAV